MQSMKECNDQESIQPSTTPDPGHHMGKWQTICDVFIPWRTVQNAIDRLVTLGLVSRVKSMSNLGIVEKPCENGGNQFHCVRIAEASCFWETCMYILSLFPLRMCWSNRTKSVNSLGPLLTNQRNAIWMAFRWWVDSVPLLCVYWEATTRVATKAIIAIALRIYQVELRLHCNRLILLVALLLLSWGCLVTVYVLWLFLTVPWVCLQCVTVVFPDHTRLPFGLQK